MVLPLELNEQKNICLEACVETLEEAILAEKKGANRLELCSRLDLDGLTPNLNLTKKVMKKISIPIKVMIRERDGKVTPLGVGEGCLESYPPLPKGCLMLAVVCQLGLASDRARLPAGMARRRVRMPRNYSLFLEHSSEALRDGISMSADSGESTEWGGNGDAGKLLTKIGLHDVAERFYYVRFGKAL